MNHKKWLVKKRVCADIVEQLLNNRGIRQKDSEKYFNPSFNDDLHDPMKLPMVKKALGLIKEIKDKKTPVAIWGDYDTDGVTSTALLYETFGRLGITPEVYIPTREEGYGLNKGGIEILHNKGIEVIFSLDCGIVDFDEIDYAKSLGTKVVVLDHHLPGEELPDAFAVINPKNPNSRYPFKYLSGCGVVYKFVQALHQKYPNKISEAFVKWSLDLVGISTAADLVELKDENRVLMKYAFIILPKAKRQGLAALYKKAAIDPKNISMYMLWYLIAPRLNAPGRIKDANYAFKLLIEKNKKKATEFAEVLDTQNRKRQIMLEEALKQAQNKVRLKDVRQKRIIILGSGNWPSGIVGLIAGKLVEKYNVPALIFNKGKDASKGSARSIGVFDVTSALRKCRKYLLGCGGHKMAAGFSFRNKDDKKFKRAMEQIAQKMIKPEDLVSKIKIDAKIFLSEVNFELLDKIKQFEPTGFGNPKILFLAKKVGIKEVRGVGSNGKHLKMRLAIDHRKILAETETEDNIEEITPAPFDPSHSAIAFGQGYWIKNLKVGDKIDIVFSVDEDNWGGKRRIDLKIVDLRRRKR